MKRILIWLASSTALLIVLTGGYLYRQLSGSLPILDGQLHHSRLTAEVTIDRDINGLVTISGESRLDVAFATGYAHAQDRFFQMDLSRRSAAGELSELFGAAALPLDRRNRFHRFRARANTVVEQASASEEKLLSAYVDGVNAGLGDLASKPFEYLVLRVEPVAWRKADSILVAYAMFMTLNDERASDDISFGKVANALPPSVSAWLYPEGSEWDAPLLGTSRTNLTIPDSSVIDLSNSKLAMRSRASIELPQYGSNSWAVSGAHTASGRALVANDMHLDIKVPNVFYRARLVVENTSDASGLTLPGTPLIVTGSNGQVAWAFTNSYGDWSDAVVLRAGEEVDTYLTPNGPRRFEIYEETIAVKGADAEKISVHETMWGPVLEQRTLSGDQIAVSWLAHHREAVNLQQIELETASNVAAALTIANSMGIPPQNFVCGDAAGNIGWTIAGKMPARIRAGDRQPSDWSVSEAWSGWLPTEDYPRVVNPSSGRIWTANTRVVDAESLQKIGFGNYALGARAKQIRDRLFAAEIFTAQDMLDIQTDDRALFLLRWRALLLSVLDDDALRDRPARVEYRELIANWIPRASIDSVGYRLVRAFRLEAAARVFEMITAPVSEMYGPNAGLRVGRQFEAPLWQVVSEQPPHMLTADYENWRELLLAAVDGSMAEFNERYEDGLTNRTWGERNTAAIRHPMSRFLPWLSRWLDMPADALSGDTHMPKALGPTFGASERFAVSPGDEKQGYLHMPTGQSGHPMSEYYRSGHTDWVQARPSKFLPGSRVHRLSLLPTP